MGSVTVEGRSLYYEEQGEGTPLVFLSGLGGDTRAFGVSLRHFAPSYRAMALDARDVGRSDRMPAGSSYTSADLADDAAAWLAAVGAGPAHVVGHSLGGLVAQELAIRHPGRVRSLVLASTHAGSNPWRKAVLASWVELRRTATPAEFTRGTLPWLVGPSFYELPQQVDGLIRFAERNEWHQDPAAFTRQARVAADHDARGRLGSIRVPTLVISGERDIVNPPPVALALAGEIAGSRVAILPDVGHLPHIEAGPRFRSEIAGFLAEFPEV